MSTRIYEQVTPVVTVPGILVGLCGNSVAELWPTVTSWVGRVSLFIVLASALVYAVLLGFHRLVPRRYANLVYLLDDNMNVALIQHPFHKRIQPPGSRLKYHERPHEAVNRVLTEELGVQGEVAFIPGPAHPEKIGDVTSVPAPIRVQIEKRKQRLGVAEHYDFVYLCRIQGVRPSLRSPIGGEWLSLAELKERARSHAATTPFEDVIPTLETLIPIAQQSV
jgi:hypothetical protein